MIGELLIIVLSLLLFVYYRIVSNGYWKRRGVTYVKPVFPLGLITDEFLGKRDAGKNLQVIYEKYKKKKMRYVGGYIVTQPVLIILDLDIFKHILTKDFNHFTDRELIPITHEYISKHLFSLEGQEWRDMRGKLTPTFTSGKMKNMFLLMERCAEHLVEHMEQRVLPLGVFQVKDLVARFTTDIIATCAFGLDVNTIEDRESQFFKTGQLMFQPRRSYFVKFLLSKYFPTFVEYLKMDVYDPNMKHLFSQIIKDTVTYRQENNFVRNDFIQLLLKVDENQTLLDDGEVIHNGNSNPKESTDHRGNDHLTLEEMIAQAFVFFAAGFETAASTTSFCLYELAKSARVQERLQEEIDRVLECHGGKVTYQALQEMTYMDQVLNETLRMYASLPFLTRVCTKDYRIPGSDLVVERGVRCTMPIYAVHHDETIYPDPYSFDPDRFSEEHVKERHNYAFLPFGEGPRNCIGMRFGKLQVKVGLTAILSKFNVSPAPDTPSSLEINPIIIFTVPKHPFNLRISTRSRRLPRT